MSESLLVLLRDTRVGLLQPGERGRSKFSFFDAYRAMPRRPVLGQWFEDNLTQPRSHRKRSLLPWFENLLPEGDLRALVCREHGVDASDDLELLEILGRDLPGAVVVRPSADTIEFDSDERVETDPGAGPGSGSSRLRFSLAGVQLKLSMSRHDDRWTLPMHGVDGDWIAKIAWTDRYIGVASNEYATMEWARAAGFDVPHCELSTLAQEGVKVLSFADPSTAPESPPPEIVRDMQLDLRLRTTAPFRVDNNVMKGVEGQVALTIGGTVSDLDLAGRVDVGTGVLDLTILGSAFDIQYGKVTLAPDFDESAVDVLATRQEPLYIDGQPRQMSVRLSGTLDAINMQCIVQGEARTRARTTRECVDYLVLGAGSREQADTSGVRRTGGGGLLGKPIGLVGSLTELKLDRYVEESAPRIAPYVPDMGLRLGQYGIEIEAETPRPWFRSEWGNLSVGAGYTRGYPGLLLRNSYNWRVRFQILDNATIELRDSKRSYYNERIIFDPLRQRSLELRIDHQLPSLR